MGPVDPLFTVSVARRSRVQPLYHIPGTSRMSQNATATSTTPGTTISRYAHPRPAGAQPPLSTTTSCSPPPCRAAGPTRPSDSLNEEERGDRLRPRVGVRVFLSPPVPTHSRWSQISPDHRAPRFGTRRRRGPGLHRDRTARTASGLAPFGTGVGPGACPIGRRTRLGLIRRSRDRPADTWAEPTGPSRARYV